MKLKNVFLILSLFTLSTQSFAAKEQQSLLNKLLAPGPLMIGHKDLEKNDCLKCHTAGKGVPDSKCLDCHKEIKKFVDTGKGFHGLHKETCIKCHNDHKGSDYDTAKVDQKTFDHKETGYILEGKHAELKCDECHKEKRTKKPIRPHDIHYLGNASTCISCHKDDDVHFFKGKWAQKDCNECHGLKSWKEDIRFNHEKDAKYKLEGKHAKLDCKECHAPKGKPTARYEWKELKTKQCFSCHEDYHKNGLSDKYRNGNCKSCHTQTEWKFTPSHPFNHEATKYPLKGAHSELECTECHKKADKPIPGTKIKVWKGLTKDCLSCHSDYHFFKTHRSTRFKSPNDCLLCHNESDWKKIHNFNHDTNTRYTINGKHEEVACNHCHIGKEWKTWVKSKATTLAGKYHWQLLEEKTCENCHDSPHKKTFSKENLKKKCTVCHVTDGWNIIKNGKSGIFNHDRDTRFKITGKHKDLKCNECHIVNKKQVFKFASNNKQFCIDCHKQIHKGQFNDKYIETSCADCHSTKSFKELLPFDHSQTRYELVGKHKELKCSECHIPTTKWLATKPPKAASKYLFTDLDNQSCSPCHKNVHLNQFSSDFRDKACLDCHNQKSFKERKPFDHDQTSFKLKHKHANVECKECHVLTKTFLPTKPPKRASKFHFPTLSKKDCAECHEDVHEGGYGNSCSECHNEKDWKQTKDFHKNFTLNGVHFTLQCRECHKEDRRLSGMSQNCYLCHQKDDVHQGSLPNCGDCHRQHFWENAEYKHSLTRFPLRGAHRALECTQCHQNGIYQGAPNRCTDCHIRSAQSVVSPPHIMPAFQDCSRCHNQFSFK